MTSPCVDKDGTSGKGNLEELGKFDGLVKLYFLDHRMGFLGLGLGEILNNQGKCQGILYYI